MPASSKSTRITYDENDNEQLGEWTQEWYDSAGRVFRTDYSGGTLSNILAYNNLGQLESRYEGPPSGTGVGPDVKITLFQYNNRGELEYTVLDMNQNWAVDLAGSDRVSKTVNEVVAVHDTTIKRRSEYEWATNADSPRLAR